MASQMALFVAWILLSASTEIKIVILCYVKVIFGLASLIVFLIELRREGHGVYSALLGWIDASVVTLMPQLGDSRT